MTDTLLLIIIVMLALQWYDGSGVRSWWADYRRMWPKRKVRAGLWVRRKLKHKDRS